MKHYLLTKEKWIPVVRCDGICTEVSLLELFEEGREIFDLSVSPAERIALMRLLFCIVYRSLPLPQTQREWESVQEQIAPQAIAYLKTWESSFDLYGEHPFLQVVGLKRINASLDKLDFTLASGNNHTLFDHLASRQGRPHPSAWQARMLLITQNFSPSGAVGENLWNGKAINKSGSCSPALEGEHPLHTFFLGDNILETLHLNLIPKEELGPLKIGIPVWEKFPNNPDEAQEFRDTLLGRLAPISRAVRLPEEGIATSLAVGCNYAKIEEFIDPYLANRRKKEPGKLSYLQLNPERHPWRELESLLTLQSSSAEVMPPKHLLNRRRIPKELRLWCGGVAVEDNAKYVFSGEWLMTFSEELLCKDEFWSQFKKFTKAAAEVAKVLKTSIDFFWFNLGNAEKRIHQNSGGQDADERSEIRGYWQRLDTLVSAFFESAGTQDPDFPQLYQQLRNTAKSFLRKVLSNQSPRGIMAYVKTMPYFMKRLNCILGDLMPEKGDCEDGK